MSDERQLNLELQHAFYATSKPRHEDYPLPGGRKFIVAELGAAEIAECTMESYRWQRENPGKPDIYYDGRVLVRAVLDENRKRVWADDQAIEVMTKHISLIDPLIACVNRVNLTGLAAKEEEKKSSASAPTLTISSDSLPDQESSIPMTG